MCRGTNQERSVAHTHSHNFRYWHSPQSALAHPGIWELLSRSRTSLYPLLQAPWCKIIQYHPLCWTYGLLPEPG